MKRLYGDRLRTDGGLTKTVKGIASKTLATKKSLPEIRRYVDEVRGSIEKVEVKVAETVEDLIENARPRLAGLAKDTKNLIQQSRQRMTITHVAKDITEYDRSRYSITVASSSSAAPVPRFHVGQPIRVSWTAPSNHSRKDWIGIYRVGSAKDALITKISSMGKWVPIFEEEYNGEEQARLSPEEQVSHGDAGIVTFRGSRLPWAPGQYELRYHHGGKHNVMSTISPIEIYVSKPSDMHSFRAVHDTLLNIVCLALDSNVNLVPRSAREMASTVRKARRFSSMSGSASASALASGVASGVASGAASALARSAAGTPPPSGLPSGLGLTGTATGADPSVAASLGRALSLSSTSSRRRRSTLTSASEIPHSLEHVISELATELEASEHASESGGTGASSVSGVPLDESLQDEDDFVLMEETQAKHISQMAQWAFAVDLNPDVVVADANVSALARRILGARILEDGSGGGMPLSSSVGSTLG
jgi:phosphatidylethanolamine N-methyltransferase